MPISALVITLRYTPSERAEHAAVLAMLASDPYVELGEPHGVRVPAVCETPTLEEGRQLFERLRRTVGVVNVDVLSIDFEDEQFDEQLVTRAERAGAE